jgi:N,N'-diacetyllegionaminate synthase
MSKVLAVITARGGSKGIPGKNTIPLAGKPLIAWTIEAALRSRAGLRVIVSTDDEEIARVARERGAEVPFLRPSELAGDASPHIPVLTHAVNWVESHEKYRPDWVLLLQPTSPMRTADDIDAALRLAEEKQADSVIGVAPAKHPCFLMQLTSDGRLEDYMPRPEGYLPRQRVPPVYAANGAIYLVRRDVLLEKETLYTDRTFAYLMPPERSLDIDTPAELRVAEAAFTYGPAPAALAIGKHKVGEGQPCFLIAEAGVNHNGRLDLALKLVDAAADAGADAVKFQTFQADELVTADAPKAEYQAANTGTAGSQLEMLRKLELQPGWHKEIQARCRKRGLIFLSTPFDEKSADLLDELKVPAFKVSSGDLTNLPFLKHLAQKRRPMILSTGMATSDEIHAALGAVREVGHTQVALLHCVTRYPADPSEMNLRVMSTMAHEFQVPIGLSDHTLGIEVSLAAVALGARVIEKHFTLDRTLPGPDHKASIEPAELAALVRGVRNVEAALGTGDKKPSGYELEIAKVARKSLVAACDIPAGTPVKREMIAIKRPGTGLAPGWLEKVVGRAARRSIRAGSVLSWDDLAE